MPATFPGYSRQGFAWLRQLATHNDRAWFRAHRPTFETHVRGATASLVEALNGRMLRFAPDYVADSSRSLSRIHRDLRFTADKTPYRTHLGAWFRRPGGSLASAAAFWLTVSARGVDVAGGCRGLGTEPLALLRAQLAEHHAAFGSLCLRKALEAAMGTLQGGMLQRVPRGWPADHPAAQLLRRKQLYFETHLPVRVATSPDLVAEIARRFRLLAPVVAWLDDALADALA